MDNLSKLNDALEQAGEMWKDASYSIKRDESELDDWKVIASFYEKEKMLAMIVSETARAMLFVSDNPMQAMAFAVYADAISRIYARALRDGKVEMKDVSDLYPFLQNICFAVNFARKNNNMRDLIAVKGGNAYASDKDAENDGVMFCLDIGIEQPSREHFEHDLQTSDVSYIGCRVGDDKESDEAGEMGVSIAHVHMKTVIEVEKLAQGVLDKVGFADFKVFVENYFVNASKTSLGILAKGIPGYVNQEVTSAWARGKLNAA